MVDQPIKCIINWYNSTLNLVYARLDKHIERKNAEEIVQQFKEDKYISANIKENILEVDAIYPVITMECTKP